MEKAADWSPIDGFGEKKKKKKPINPFSDNISSETCRPLMWARTMERFPLTELFQQN